MNFSNDNNLSHDFEVKLERYLRRYCSGAMPAKLEEAIIDATLSAGGRLRPSLCLCVARSYDQGYDEELALASALAVELIHCASLVHDDLPCFDDASTRRGKPSVHVRYGESTAVLTGDGLIVMAFEVLIRATTPSGRNLRVLELLADSVGPLAGIIAGQAWEAEKNIDLYNYHQAKTASLFEFAAMAGAVAAGQEDRTWRDFGRAVGLAYQTADDLADEAGASGKLGKPTGQDYMHRRPKAVHSSGIRGALLSLEEALKQARLVIPDHCDQKIAASWLLELRHRMLAWFQDESSTAVVPRRSASVCGKTVLPRLL